MESIRKIRLIVVDGNELIRGLLNLVFHASSAIEILGEAADYRSAVVVLGRAIPDAVILGDDLPYADRYALLSAIHSDYPGVQVIELSTLKDALVGRMHFLAQDGLGQSALNAIVAGSLSGSAH